MTHNTRRLISCLVALSFGAACVIVKTARVYDLDNGTILQATFKYSGSGKGPVACTKSDAVSCSGEYVTVASGTTGWGTVFAPVYPPGGRGTTATGAVITSEVDRIQKGSAVATCSHGMVVEC